MGMGQGLTGVYNPLLDIYYMLMKNEIPHNTQLIDCLMRAKQALEVKPRVLFLSLAMLVCCHVTLLSVHQSRCLLHMLSFDTSDIFHRSSSVNRT